MKLGTGLVLAVLWGTSCACAQAPAGSSSMERAVSGTVTGNDQRVGFRAMIMKQAIKYNLAGYAKNLPNNVVNFSLQGDGKRLDRAVMAVRAGTKKSSNIEVTTEPGTVDRLLGSFTIVDWTSTSRNITTPYNLVFNLRSEDTILSASDVKHIWQNILKSTLRGDDLNKLRGDD